MLNSIVLPVHNEGHILLKTLDSLRDALFFAAGHEFELVIVRDKADEQTKHTIDCYDYSAFFSVKIIDVAFGSAGLARNAGVRAAGGDFIFFLDGDDLISYNYFAETADVRDKEEDRGKIYFPEFYCGFGAKDYIVKFYDMKTASPLMMFSHHIWGSTIAAYRKVLLNIPQKDIPISLGYAYEDWCHNLELLARGYNFSIVPNIIMFYRKRKNTGVYTLSTSVSAGIPPASLYYKPDIYVNLCRSDYNKYKFAKNIKLPESQIARQKAPKLSCFFERAHAIEPLINKEGKVKYAGKSVSAFAANLKPSLTYFEICDIIKGKMFDHIFLIPFLAKGGAEKYILNIIAELNARFPLSRILIIGGENYNGQLFYDRLPSNAIFLDIGTMSGLDIADNCLLTLRVIEAVSKHNTKIHLLPCPYVLKFMGLYRTVLRDKIFVFYYFCRNAASQGGYELSDANFKYITQNADLCSLLIGDNKNEFHEVVKNEPVSVKQSLEKSFKPLYTLCPVVRKAEDYEPQPEAGLFWASRIDRQKRVSLLPLIGEKLSALKKKLHVYGYSAFKPKYVYSLQDMRGIDYHGAFDGVSSLPAQAYDIFVYTSYIDGMPNVVLEAIAAGLLVIAPDVGGIGEIIKNGETGILLPSLDSDEAMAKSYIKAIKQAYKDPQRRRKLVLNAQRLLKEQHSEKYFARRVAELFPASIESADA